MVQPVFLSPLVEKLTGFGQVNALQMVHNSFNSHWAIDEIDLEEIVVKIMGPYNPSEPVSRIIDQLEKGREFAREEGQTISDAMMIYKGITILAQTATSNK